MNCDMAPKQEVEDLMESKPEEIESSPQFVKRRTELPKPQHYKNTIHLWEYLLELLSDDSCRSFITWSRQDYGEFKLKDQEEVAKRWGLLKRKKGMNYEKLSRALRYYYRQEIIKKVPGQRLVYKFNKLPYKYVPGVTRSHHQLQRIHDSIHTQERRRVSPPKQLSASPPCRLEVHESSAFSRTPTPLGKCWSWPVVPMPPRTLSWYPGNIAGMPPMCFAGSEIFKFPVVKQMSPISGSFVVRPVSPVSPVYKMCAAPRSIPVSVIKQAA